MKKILLISDSPYATTGLGRMSKYFLNMLPEFEWTVYGFLHPEFHLKNGKYSAIYHDSDFKAKFRIISPQSYTDNQYGLEFIPDIIQHTKPDYIITSMDYNRIVPAAEAIKKLQFTLGYKWINYFPVDREVMFPIELDAYRYPDINVSITKFGVDKMKLLDPKIDIKQIYHPIDANDFPEVDREELKGFKTKVWPTIQSDTFIFGTVNRSFARKDTARLAVIMTKLLNKYDNTYAYIHGSKRTFEKMELTNIAYEYGVPERRMSFLPDQIAEVQGVANETLNKIYRNMGMFLTVSNGEGFGYSTVEALLTETPIVAPRNTSFPELIQDFGALVDISDYAFHYNGLNSMWPFVNVDEFVAKVDEVKANYKDAKTRAKKGSKWVKENLNLKVIGDQWRQLLK